MSILLLCAAIVIAGTEPISSIHNVLSVMGLHGKVLELGRLQEWLL